MTESQNGHRLGRTRSVHAAAAAGPEDDVAVRRAEPGRAQAIARGQLRGNQ
jgi:hypothetical protein